MPALDMGWVGLLAAALLLSHPLYILMMLGVLRIAGVDREARSKWALKQADLQKSVTLLRAAGAALGRLPGTPGATAIPPGGGDPPPA